MIYKEVPSPLTTGLHEYIEKPVRIHSVVRRWWARRNNTEYFSAECYLNGKLVVRIEDEAGHGNHGEHKIFDALESQGFITDRDNREAPWTYCEKRGLEYTTYITNVSRKKDMMY